MKNQLLYKKQRGIAAIEFTIILPLFLVLIFFTAELGRALYQYSQLTRMIRDAGRHLSQTIITTGNGVPSDLIDAYCNGCISETTNILIYGASSGATTQLSGISITDISISEFPIDSGIMVISVDYDWTPIFFDKMSGFGSGEGIDLSFSMNSTYAVRAI
ncbi:pilus assembly protein TadE [Shewanella sp. Choline-02u-19]|uniref:TadE/TadG family type IV pilus assembly protein n=1 Tax=unclassified Shewanella TaxID=196818 RepID=UPI000C324AE0|nr:MULTISPECIES: TadE/TadG family type IV pilus assembly protein [unclassified Shewanella]PKG57319.1 pilus assembly protein TadE [Shewanella sp. GutDb-MelDb]PKH62884.1 pilus assembly protein TadE [Shewanella sp. Bg11-22]PKI27611.1 pilus assembly protein TadE [Shewanella sp. Choline-02u-19]